MSLSLERGLHRTDLDDRLKHGLAALGLIGWLGYTRVFWTLHALHLTIPPCPFLLITGHPCPFCGGTRSFAAIWHGDLIASIRLYPLGPAVFGATLAATGYGVLVALSGRSLRLRIPDELVARAAKLGAAVLGLSWLLKLMWLGN